MKENKKWEEKRSLSHRKFREQKSVKNSRKSIQNKKETVHV